ncbi:MULTISPECIES: FAD-dependent 5-carboxymethylaminomethyl-2-thiouridine(34) oxidoreductase MnmC [Psychrobacter]|uniref:FAD-dependent 5-carboxymethylaminomethyl-2-thiouridine(34) oxidoreductase MnmC n=1 Tax=Psychrobacter TaxID=497 RepID=UPI00146CEF6C|nr:MULTISPECIES: FAD-dependent 5-carboxymethylaminomethyl-2-thiouridine(34) oxidoreductase MnmC [Psychrobacter]
MTITPANIDWQLDDLGNEVPVSTLFGDVYFSNSDGLCESQFVFVDHNDLPNRLAKLAPKQTFSVAEIGFGTGLNLLVLWQLWRDLRQSYPQLATSRLHFITTEKYPLTQSDLAKALASISGRAPKFADLIDTLLSAYPPLVEGCHRLNFFEDNLTVDIWFGDAAQSLQNLAQPNEPLPKPTIDAWFLDGFAPSCNEDLWAQAIFAQIERLSTVGTTAATFSAAGVVKRGLTSAGFLVKKVKGFGKKREMITAVIADNNAEPLLQSKEKSSPQTLIIGAGVSGLMAAWSLAHRGHHITLIDKIAPLAGASGNPRALLAPKMTPIAFVAEHLHSLAYFYSSRFYQALDAKAPSDLDHIVTPTAALDLLTQSNVDTEQIKAYPDEVATTLDHQAAQKISGIFNQDFTDNLFLPKAALINPQALKSVVLEHPNINFKAVLVNHIEDDGQQAIITAVLNNTNDDNNAITISADRVIICAGYQSHLLHPKIFNCRKIRGQLSWFTPTANQLAKLPKIPLKYSGYCATFTPTEKDADINQINYPQSQFLLGASFDRNDEGLDTRDFDHQANRDKLISTFPELDAAIPTDFEQWQARVGIRSQTPDYHPLVGRLSANICCLTAMGSKGYAFAPLCSEVLADLISGNFAPVSSQMLAKLAPNRARLQTPLKP